VDPLAEKGRSEQVNRECHTLAEREGQEVVLTTDQNLPHQKDLARQRVGVVVRLSKEWSAVRLRTGEIAPDIEVLDKGQAVEIRIRPKWRYDRGQRSRLRTPHLGQIHENWIPYLLMRLVPTARLRVGPAAYLARPLPVVKCSCCAPAMDPESPSE